MPRFAIRLALTLVVSTLAEPQVLLDTKSPDAPPVSDTSTSAGALEQVRSLDVPAASATVNAEHEHASFWEANGSVLRLAWHELAASTESTGDGNNNNFTISDIVEPNLQSAIQSTHENPTLSNEERVLSFFNEAGPPGKAQAYETRLMSPEGLRTLRAELDRATSSGIPLRRPNGMNRHGCIIDDKVDGAVSLPTLTRFVQGLIDDIGRPVGRMLFPDSVGTEDDTDYFAFTIRYNAEEDMELKEHRDASVVTINVNLNLPDEEYDGSSLYLLDEEGGGSARHSITFDPGMMLIHRGSVRHAALPITSGTRHNLVIWLFGEDGTVRFAPYGEDERLSVEQRWGRASDSSEQAAGTNSDARTVSGWKRLFEL